MQFKQIKNDLMEALAANKPKTAPYDTEAQVVRVEGSTAWVHIPGGVDETPVAMTINASAGDTVRVRVGNGTAWLVGNDTAPPTDDHTAIIASRQAAQAAAIARKTVELTEDLNQRIANANGLYETRITQSGGATITYMHNKQNLADSDIQMMISDVGVLVTANGTDASPTWYGLTVDGNLIANILQANGINADWINSGALVIYDDNDNEIFRADKSGKIFRWNMTHSQMTADGDITLRRTYDSSQGGDSSAPAFSSQKTDIIHNYDTVIAVKKNVSDVKYGEDIFMKHSTYLYGTEADYSSDSPDLTAYDSVSLSPKGLVFSTYSSDPYTPDDNPIEILPGDYSTASHILLDKESLSRRAFTRIPQNANLNSYTKPGNYYVLDSDASTISNSPWTSYNYQLLVFSYFRDDMTLQIAWRDSVHESMKFRLRNSNGTWGVWRSLSSETGYKTGQITIPTGTSATATASINFSDVVPIGRTVYGVSLRLVSGSSSYLIPYVNASGNVVTWISQLTDSALTLSNKTTAWSNYTYYLAVFFH